MHKLTMLAGVSALVLIPHVAIAQEDPPAQEAPAQRAVVAVEEVVVTAQRREERLQDVPLTVSVQTAEDLEQALITDSRDLTKIVPGLNYAMNGSWVQPAIRGVTSTSSQSANDANVAIYIDGIYHPNQQSNVFELPDVQRIEVLKGPQGTLFGRNATGGSIQVWTVDPSTSIQSGKVSLSASAYETNGANYLAKAFLSTPLVEDRVGLSVATMMMKDTGFLYNITDQDQFGSVDTAMVRGKLLFTPTDDVRITAGAYYTFRKDHATQAGQALNGNTLARALFPGIALPTTPWEVATDYDYYTETDDVGAHLRVAWDLPGGTLTSLTGYSRVTSLVKADVDVSGAAIVPISPYMTDEPFSQEFNFTSEEMFDRLSYVAGVYYYHNDSTFQNLFAGINADVETTAWAAFGEVNFDITSQLRIIAGARYSWEEKVALAGVFLPPPTEGNLPPNIPLLGEESWDSWTPRVSLIYQMNDAVNLYLTYSEGFKSGAFSPSSLQTFPADPEYISAIEGGVKIATPAYHLNLAAFSYDYTDLQLQFFNGFVSMITNAANAKIAGMEVDGEWYLSDNFNLRGAVAWLPKAEYEDFPGAPINVPTGNGGNTQVVVDASGFRMLKAPELTASFTGQYTFRLPSADLVASSTVYYTSDFNWELAGRVKEPGYTTVSGQLSYEPYGENYRISLWGKNLTNEAYTQGQVLSVVSDYLTYAPPRQIGVTLEYNF